MNKSRFGRIIVVLAALAALIPMAASAQSALTVRTITWDIIGLDSVSSQVALPGSPNTYPTGIRVTNTGTTTLTNVQATFNWVTAPSGQTNNTAISLVSTIPATFSTPSIAPGQWYDFYWNVEIVKASANWNTRRYYRIDVTSTQVPGPTSTSAGRYLYVEKLQSQARNQVVSFTGPTNGVFVGIPANFVLNSTTATQGYEQLTTWSNFPPERFEIITTNLSYSAPSGYTTNTYYSDACGWNNLTRACVGPETTSTGKGGGEIVSNITVIPRVNGTASIYHLIYDISGASAHYNNDAATDVTVLTVYNPAYIGDLIWFDANNNNVYNPGIDNPVPNAQVSIRHAGTDSVFGTADDVTLGTATTNSSGTYTYGPLIPRDYRVVVNGASLPSNYVPVLGQTGSVTNFVAEGATVNTFDFGFASSNPLWVDLVDFTAAPAADGEGIELTWETAAEVDNVGFNVFRAVREDNSRSSLVAIGDQVNGGIIPAAGKNGGGAVYSLVDPLPVGNKEISRSYFLEDVDVSGKVTRYGPFAVEIPESLRSSDVTEWVEY